MDELLLKYTEEGDFEKAEHCIRAGANINAIQSIVSCIMRHIYLLYLLLYHYCDY